MDMGTIKLGRNNTMINKGFIYFILFFYCSLKFYSLEYTNSLASFSLNVPEEVLEIKNIYKQKNKGFYIQIDIKKDDEVLGGVGKFEEIKKSINNNLPPDIPNIPSIFIKYLEIERKKICIDFNMGFGPEDNFISKRMTFIYEDKLVSINLFYCYDLYDNVGKNKVINLIDYYQKKKIKKIANDKEIIEIMNELEDDIINKNKVNKDSVEIPNELIILYKNFDKLIKTLRFKIKLLKYESTINNLRFRDLPSKNSEIIRLLNQNEKLEILEFGNEETINNVKGNWVKVRTEKGEIGWCFDAYLEELKE